jgi:hypothetical protein
MTRAQVVYLHLCVILMTITGAVFAWTKYAMHPADEFAVINHPMQPWMLAAHVVFAPLCVFAFGWIFGPHIAPMLTSGGARRRPSGLWTFAALAPMVLSGYLLQVSTADATRRAMAIAHWASSALFVGAYVVHVLKRKAKY